ncbi:hypothetical protein AMJ87_00325 [candidate division WOR_3 bacterium SM23_60]|uniref:FlgD Ig-like domain-containing protein n=1 Tax=candidate division WOR_3 bacterium SM23_60 TaxID=1703780 RepID=A0A0S8GLQ7_UNCW3|nr:MAG: hypothetical protein AMJ87_00325 [candidate division WOR_3 bacterium SM23_60]
MNKPASVELCVYDASGRFINCLLKDTLEPGEYHTMWDGTDERRQNVSSGIYFVRHKIGDSHKVEKAVLVKKGILYNIGEVPHWYSSTWALATERS